MTRTADSKLMPLKVSHDHPIAAINTDVTVEVREKLKDSFKFDQAALKRTVELALTNNQLFDAAKKETGLTLAILVTHVRVRSTFNAVMWGAMSGNDAIHGEVVVKDSSGATFDTFKVTASYALGGWGGGQDGLRLNWLYEAFAKEVVKAFTDGEKKA